MSSSRKTEGPKGSEYCESHEYPGIHDCAESSEGPQGFEGPEVPEGPKGREGSDGNEVVSDSC